MRERGEEEREHEEADCVVCPDVHLLVQRDAVPRRRRVHFGVQLLAVWLLAREPWAVAAEPAVVQLLVRRVEEPWAPAEAAIVLLGVGGWETRRVGLVARRGTRWRGELALVGSVGHLYEALLVEALRSEREAWARHGGSWRM